jgi:hypothetical protein
MTESKTGGTRVLGAIVAGIFGVFLAWVGVSVMTERGVKEPAYEVEREAEGYEVRRYAAYLVAEAEVPPGTEDPLGAGFRILFDYIGGANQGNRKIEMTAPVLQETPSGEKIPMTKPVLRRQEGGATRVAFVLPADYTLETAPLPKNPRIGIREVSARRVAVIRFSGYATDTLVVEKRELLASLLDRDGVQPAGEFLAAYYNPPWTPPFMRRNEVMVEID